MVSLMAFLGGLVAVFWAFRMSLRLAFYRAYFRQKQRDLGREPDTVLRHEFGSLWWYFR